MLNFDKKNRKLVNGLIVVAVIATLSGIYFGHNNEQQDRTALQELSATVLDSARPVTPFSLTDQSGKEFTNKNLEGKWTMMFFGFTHCPAICPTTMAELNKFYLKLKQESDNAQVVFVTIDPERDDIARLKEYVNSFNSHFIGLTGKPDRLKTLSRELGIMTMEVPKQVPNQATNYNIDHSGTILLINPKAQLHAIFSMPHDGDSMADDFQVIRKFYG